jgi:dihydroxy-acid dehydratase
MSGDRNTYLRETQAGENPGSCMMVPTGAYGKNNIGIGHFGYDFNPCNGHLEGLAHQVREGFKDSVLKANIFATAGVSDGISMGYDVMRHSLVSRDVGALSIINHASAAPYEGLILIPGCDKNMPAAAMALLHLNMPGYILAGGSIKPGRLNGEDIDIVNSFLASGQKAKGSITDAERRDVQTHACPGMGACGGMYTANSMFTIFEAMGLSPLHSSSTLADNKSAECYSAHEILEEMVAAGRRPSDFISKASFENAARIVSVLGGSTNPIMHLRAMARAADIDFTEGDFERVASETPFIANLMPSGKYRMKDLSEAGGTPAVLQYMLDEGHLDGDMLTLTGRPIWEDLSKLSYDKSRLLSSDVIQPFKTPYLNRSHLVLVEGNLGSGWTKISGAGDGLYEGRAVIFENEAHFNETWENKVTGDGDFVIIRNEGPKGAPGMPEMLKPTTLITGKFGKDAKIGMMTDGRFSGGSCGGAPIIGHVDEAFNKGLIAIIEDGDVIRVDPKENSMNLEVAQDVLDARLAAYSTPDVVTQRIAKSPEDLKQYHRQTSSAREGATMLFQ